MLDVVGEGKGVKKAGHLIVFVIDSSCLLRCSGLLLAEVKVGPVDQVHHEFCGKGSICKDDFRTLLLRTKEVGGKHNGKVLGVHGVLGREARDLVHVVDEHGENVTVALRE